MRKSNLVFLALGAVLLISFVSASDYLSVYVVPFDGTGAPQPNTLFNFGINLTTNSTCGISSNIVSNFQINSVTTNSIGGANLTLDVTGMNNLTSVKYYCVYANGTFVTSFPKTASVSSSGYFDQTINTTSNVFASGNITSNNYGFFSYLGSLLNRITSIFAINGNFSGTLNGTSIYESGSQVWAHSTLANLSQLNNDVPYALNSSLANYYPLNNPYAFWNSTYYGGIGNWSADKSSYSTTSAILGFNYFNVTGNNYLYSSGHSLFANTTTFDNRYWTISGLQNISQLNNDVPYRLQSNLTFNGNTQTNGNANVSGTTITTNLNSTGDINLENDAVITRTGTNTAIGINSGGTVVEKL